MYRNPRTALVTSFITVLVLQHLPHLSIAQTACSWTGNDCDCDGGFIAPNGCNLPNTAVCVDECLDDYESCGRFCKGNQVDCIETCIDTVSLTCLCDCEGRATDCVNTCTEAYDSCSCDCEPPTERPARSPIKQPGPSPSIPSNNDGGATSTSSSVAIPITTTAISAASSAITVTLFVVLWVN